MIRKFKWFWLWQDDKEEAWVGEMSRQGLHLKSVGLLGQYVFEKGEPREFAYFMSFAAQPEDDKTLQEEGWERVGQLGAWQYWRKVLNPGETREISPGLKRHKYQKVLGLLIIFLPIFIVLMTRADNIIQRYQHWSIEVLFGAFYVFFLLYIFAILTIVRRVTTLQRNAGKGDRKPD